MGIPILHCGMVPQWLTLLALNSNTGEEMWHYSVDESVYEVSGVGFPILVDDSLFFYTNYYEDEESYYINQEKSDLFCLDAHTGTLKWKKEGVLPSSLIELDSITPAWITYYNNRIYVSMKGYVIALNTETGKKVWEYRLSKGWDAFLSCGHQMVVANGEGSVYCLDAEEGKELWKVPIDGGSTMPAVTKGDTFIGSSDGTLYRVDLESGEIVWSQYVGGFLCSPVVAHGYVFVGSSNNILYCFGPSHTFFRAGLIVCAIVVVMGFLLFKKNRTSP